MREEGDGGLGVVTKKVVYRIWWIGGGVVSVVEVEVVVDVGWGWWRENCSNLSMKSSLDQFEKINENFRCFIFGPQEVSPKGILHQTSVARTPEQNRVVERQNRTLAEAARTMLSAAKVPLFFWAEAIGTACFTQNRSLVIL
nr:putative ribonuclease H-like domain-containing protein [Tanacetum cinerariifolium]